MLKKISLAAGSGSWPLLMETEFYDSLLQLYVWVHIWTGFMQWFSLSYFLVGFSSYMHIDSVPKDTMKMWRSEYHLVAFFSSPFCYWYAHKSVKTETNKGHSLSDYPYQLPKGLFPMESCLLFIHWYTNK